MDVQPDAGTPEWWLTRLERDLADRRDRIATYYDYYEGTHPLTFASSRFRSTFGRLFDNFADNWCDLVVDAVEERLNVEGFRFGTDPTGDEEAWRIWQANQLDADSTLAHQAALIAGEAYALVWWGDDDATPSITIEHAGEVIVAHAPDNRRRRRAALKSWLDEDEHERATLYLPDGLYKFRSRSRAGRGLPSSPARWEPLETDSEPWPLPNPIGRVPIVPLLNRPHIVGGGQSEIGKVIPLQNAANKLLADMLIASEYAAFKQRWATGLEIPEDPETGEPLEPFQSAVDRLWISEDTETVFGEFAETSLPNFVAAIEMVVQHIASQTRTPPHYFYLSGNFPSGESIKSAETGLVAKARRKMRFFGEAWEETLRLAFLVVGDRARASVMDAETIWADPESRTEGEHIDATIKLQALGVPQEALWERAGFTPQQIQRFRGMIREAALESDVLALNALTRFDNLEPAGGAAPSLSSQAATAAGL